MVAIHSQLVATHQIPLHLLDRSTTTACTRVNTCKSEGSLVPRPFVVRGEEGSGK